MDIKISICLLFVFSGSSLCSQKEVDKEQAIGKRTESVKAALVGRSNSSRATAAGPPSRQTSIKSGSKTRDESTEGLARSVSKVKINEEGKEKGKEKSKDKAKEDEIPPWRELVDLIKKRDQSQLLRELKKNAKEELARKMKLDSQKSAGQKKKDKEEEEKKIQEAKYIYENPSVAQFIENCAVGDGGQFRYMTTEDGQRTRTFEFEALPLIGLTDETKMILATMPEKSEKYSNNFIDRSIIPERLFLLAKAIGEQGEGEHIVGFAVMQMRSLYNYHVECVSVEPEFQKHEISSRLVRIIVETVGKLPTSFVARVWTIDVKNEDEMKAYESNGFKPNVQTAKTYKFERIFKHPRDETYGIDK